MYTRPRSIEDAVAFLAGTDALVVNGGTDVFPAHAARPLTRPVVDLSAIAALRVIEADAESIRIGGGVAWSAIAAAPLPPAFDALKQAAREIGSIQIQNRGTIAGNLCNASPAADGIPPLLVLDAAVELRSHRGTRTMPLQAFLLGYRRTAIASGEILSAVIVPAPSPGTTSAFVKVGSRRYMVISVVMAAASLERDAQGRIASAAVAVGAASAVARRLPELERALLGLGPGIAPSALLNRHHTEHLTPIDDVRASAAYRLEAARVAAGEALDRAAGVRGGG